MNPGVLRLAAWVALGFAPAANAVPVLVRFTSDPPGLLDQQIVVESGTSVTTPTIALETTGVRFVHWKINGTPQRDDLGHARIPLTFTPFADTTFVAEYDDADDDLDLDGIPDSLELFVLGSTSESAASDTDGDGLSLSVEIDAGTSPRAPDVVDAGGRSVAAAALVRVPAQGVAEIVERSAPFGVLADRFDFVPIGNMYTSSIAPLEPNGFRFYEWSVNGTPVRDAAGRAVNEFSTSVTGDLTATARYVAVSTDADGDGIVDWFELEHFGTTTVAAASDTDGDTLTLATEFRAGTSPLAADAVDAGGVSFAAGAFVEVPAAGIAEIFEASSPPGFLSELRAYVATGSNYATRLAPDTVNTSQFAFWTQNGAAVRDATGLAVNPVDITIAGDATFRATYVPRGQDTDSDGLADVDELRYFGSLERNAQSDGDADGVPLGRELSAGTSPLAVDTVDFGGVSFSAALLEIADLRPFPRIREVLVDGVPEGFFAAEPTASATADATFGLDSNTSPALGDWDGDGDLDLFVAGRSGGATVVRVYRNGGSSVVASFERVQAFESAFGAALSGIATPALALGDADGDARADLAIGGSTGTVTVLRSTGSFSGSPATLATIATGDASAIPGIADTNGDSRADLLIVRPDGSARAYLHGGNNAAPYSPGLVTQDALPAPVPGATSVSAGDITEDGNADVVVSDANGSVSEFHRQLAGGFQLVSRIYGGTADGYANRLAAALGDLDGDGDGDVVAGFAEGGLLYLRNQVRKLSVEPPVRTLVAGQPLDFEVDDPGGAESPQGPLTWRFVSNRSGGTLDGSTGAYVSGAQSRRVDVVEAEDARGVTGRAYVNVIDPADQTQVGKAIIVAGGFGTDDAIWGATRTTANRMYRALLHRGYRPQDIRYLSLAYGEALDDANRVAANDLDGDGVANDELYGLPLPAVLEESITGWAAGAADLLLVMIDHGSNRQFTLNGPVKLDVAALDGWLDAQQAGGGTATLVLDFCFAGSFLDPLKSVSAPRIVLASTAGSEPAYLFDGGEVSFSQGVARGVFQGFDLEQTFAQARETMLEHQSAQLDDDGSGTYVPAQDGSVARSKVIGPTYAVGQDIPVIESVSASAPSPDGTSVVETLGAEGSSGVVSVHPLARVWCTVEAPGAVGGVPQANLPEVPLAFDRETGTYRAEVGGFTEAGAYRVSCYAKDIHASVSFPATTNVTRPLAHEARVVVVVAGDTTDPGWSAARAIGDATVQTVRARGYAPQQLYYLTRGAPPAANGCAGNCAPTQANIATALGTWLASGVPANEVSLFLVASDGTGALSLGAGQTLDPAALDAALDAFQDAAPANTVRPVNVVVDHAEDACTGIGRAFNSLSPASCTAASLIGALAPQGNEPLRDRAVFVSSGAGQPNARLAGGTVSFTQLFLSHALDNRSLGDAVSESRQTLDFVTRTSTSVQRPYFDLVTPAGRGAAGTPNETSDLSGLRARFLGGLVRSSAPTTSGMASLQSPVGSPVKIYVKANATEAQRTLTAIVTPPGGADARAVKAAAGLQSTSLQLVYDAATRRYEGTYTPATSGEHSVLIYAQNQALSSVPDEATLMAGGTARGVSLATAPQPIAEGGSLLVTATLDSAATERVVVPFTLSGNAGLQVDYTVDAVQFEFAAGTTSASIVLAAAVDGVLEEDETIVLALGEGAGAVASPPTETRLTIANVGGILPNDVFADGFE